MKKRQYPPTYPAGRGKRGTRSLQHSLYINYTMYEIRPRLGIMDTITITRGVVYMYPLDQNGLKVI